MASSDNWTCPACQTVNGDQQTCSVCETPRAAQTAPTERVPQVPIVAAPNAPGQGQGPAYPYATAQGAAATAPGQELAGAGAGPPPAPSRRGLYLGLATVLVVLAMGGAFLLGTQSSDDPATAERASVDREDEGPSTTEAKEASPTGAPKATSTLPEAPVLATTPQPTIPPTAPTVPTADFPTTGRTWVALRASLGDEASAQEMAARIPGAYVFPTDPWASLTPGYWAVAIGTYASSDEALEYCRANDLYLANDCVALPVSQDPTDRDIPRPSLESE